MVFAAGPSNAVAYITGIKLPYFHVHHCYIEQDWFAEIDIKLYSLYFFIVILQSYITRARKFSIVYTLVSIGISVGLYMIHETYGYVRGIELATENISYLWLYSMIALYFTSSGEHYIGEIINRIKKDWHHPCYIYVIQHCYYHEFMVLLHHH